MRARVGSSVRTSRRHLQAEPPTLAVLQPLLRRYVSHSSELARASQLRYSADVVVTYFGTLRTDKVGVRIENILLGC